VRRGGGRVERKQFGKHHVSLIGSEKTLSTCELCLAACAQCFLATMIRESGVKKLPLESISVFARGVADVRPLIDPESVEVPRFSEIEMVVSVSLKSSDDGEDVARGGRERSSRSKRSSTSSRSGGAVSVNDVFERAKVKAPVCNSIRYGVPVEVKARVLTTEAQLAAVKAGGAKCDDIVQLAHLAQRAEIEAEAVRDVEALLKYLDADHTRSSIASYDVEVTAVGPPGDLGADLSFSFPGLMLGGRDDRFRRSHPIVFSASDPDATLRNSAAGVRSSRVERFGEWPDAVTSIVGALGSCVAVSACYRSSGKGRRVTMDHMGVDVVGSWDADGFAKDEGDLDAPVQFWAMSCGVNVELDDEELSDVDSEEKLAAIKHEKEKELVHVLEMAKKASFVANTLSGKTKLSFALRIER